MRPLGGSADVARRTFAAFGIVVEVEVDDDVARASLDRLLAPMSCGLAGLHQVRVTGGTVVRDGRFVAQFTDTSSAVGFVIHQVNQIVLERTGQIAAHAAAVVWRDCCIVIPGEANSGKSTLTAALLQEGAQYLTDEAVSFPSGLVAPYQKPLGLSVESMAVLGLVIDGLDSSVDHHVTAEDLGGSLAMGPRAVDALVFPRFAGADAAPEATPISRAEAVMRLSAQSFRFADQPREIVRMHAKVTTGARCWMLQVGSPAATVELLARGLFDG